MVIINNLIKKFNENKLEDMSLVENLLIAAPPRINASIECLIKEQDVKMNLSKGFLYYYRLLEYSNINLKKYKDDKETIDGINDMINEYYMHYQNILERIKNRDYED